MLDWLQSIDADLVSLINVTWAHPFLDQWLSLIADLQRMKWFLGAGILALLIWGGFRGRAFIVLMAACLLIGDAGINWTIKRAVDRPRPHETVEGLRRIQRIDAFNYRIVISEPSKPEHGRSMTSGHACNNFAAAYILMRLFPPWGALAWIWAALIAYSRIYGAHHYPGDIFVSFFVAWAYSALICYGASMLWQKFGPKLLPDCYEKNPHLFPSRS